MALLDELHEGKTGKLKSLSDADFALLLSIMACAALDGVKILCPECRHAVKKEIDRRVDAKGWVPREPINQHPELN